FVILVLLATSTLVFSPHVLGNDTFTLTYTEQILAREYVFSDPTIVEGNDSVLVQVPEGNLNRINPGKPVLPVNLTVWNLPFGSRITEVNYSYAEPEVFNLSKPLVLGTLPFVDSIRWYEPQRNNSVVVSGLTIEYPDGWVSYQTGGGLFQGNHTTFLSVQIYPVRYNGDEQQLLFIRNMSLRVTVLVPVESLLPVDSVYDLLILAPRRFSNALQPLVSHKNQHGVQTSLVTLEEVYDQIAGQGRDSAEKVKLFIKQAVEESGVRYVLLVGGRKGQTYSWYFPVRYSHVVPYDEQEYAEQSFLSDLYFADLYDGAGGFSSWDSNGNGVYGEWTNSARDEMDVFPDVYLGRLPCLNAREVSVMVDKIVAYESDDGKEWFSRMVFVAGDSYNDTHHFNEGELIAAEVLEHMLGFTAVNVFASEQDITRESVNSALDGGCGFAYFCGHGNPQSWNTHYPPDGVNWCTGYITNDMIYLKNKEKLPVVVVGGCHNGQYDVTMRNILAGIREEGLRYFSTKGTIGSFWYNEWIPRCWSWQLTVKKGGGAIATISNTGLGTHGDGDIDQNGIPDYLEVLNGWMEIRFFQLYGEQHRTVLGENHGDTLTQYLLRFLGNGEQMDTKMVQQWALFGDPSLMMG
ncbi:MAG: C25 family cysteine peptidase, partial [Methanobacteriota archaeon]